MDGRPWRSLLHLREKTGNRFLLKLVEFKVFIWYKGKLAYDGIHMTFLVWSFGRVCFRSSSYC